MIVFEKNVRTSITAKNTIAAFLTHSLLFFPFSFIFSSSPRLISISRNRSEVNLQTASHSLSLDTALIGNPVYKIFLSVQEYQ